MDEADDQPLLCSERLMPHAFVARISSLHTKIAVLWWPGTHLRDEAFVPLCAPKLHFPHFPGVCFPKLSIQKDIM